MSKRINILVLIALVGCIGISCDSGPDFLKSSGEVTEVEIDLDGFHTISAIDEVDIFLSQGKDQEVRIRAGKNLISKIELNVEDSILTITNKNTFNWIRSAGNPEIYITMNDLKGLETRDFINIYAFDTLFASNFYIYAYSTGDIRLLLSADSVSITSIYISVIELKGRANKLWIESTSDSKVLTREFIVDDIQIEHLGSNRMEVFPLHSLSGKLSGTGDLIYYNDPPELNVSTKSSGQAYHAP